MSVTLQFDSLFSVPGRAFNTLVNRSIAPKVHKKLKERFKDDLPTSALPKIADCAWDIKALTFNVASATAITLLALTILGALKAVPALAVTALLLWIKEVADRALSLKSSFDKGAISEASEQAKGETPEKGVIGALKTAGKKALGAVKEVRTQAKEAVGKAATQVRSMIEDDEWQPDLLTIGNVFGYNLVIFKNQTARLDRLLSYICC